MEDLLMHFCQTCGGHRECSWIYLANHRVHACYACVERCYICSELVLATRAHYCMACRDGRAMCYQCTQMCPVEREPRCNMHEITHSWSIQDEEEEEDASGCNVCRSSYS
jgi:hypothetical protein